MQWDDETAWATGESFYNVYSDLSAVENKVISFDIQNLQNLLADKHREGEGSGASHVDLLASRIRDHYIESSRIIKRAFGSRLEDNFQVYNWGLTLALDMGLDKDKVEFLILAYGKTLPKRISKEDFEIIIRKHTSYKNIAEKGLKHAKMLDLLASFKIHQVEKDGFVPTIGKKQLLVILDVNEIELCIDLPSVIKDMKRLDKYCNKLHMCLLDDPLIRDTREAPKPGTGLGINEKQRRTKYNSKISVEEKEHETEAMKFVEERMRVEFEKQHAAERQKAELRAQRARERELIRERDAKAKEQNLKRVAMIKFEREEKERESKERRLMDMHDLICQELRWVWEAQRPVVKPSTCEPTSSALDVQQSQMQIDDSPDANLIEPEPLVEVEEELTEEEKARREIQAMLRSYKTAKVEDRLRKRQELQEIMDTKNGSSKAFALLAKDIGSIRNELDSEYDDLQQSEEMISINGGAQQNTQITREKKPAVLPPFERRPAKRKLDPLEKLMLQSKPGPETSLGSSTSGKVTKTTTSTPAAQVDVNDDEDSEWAVKLLVDDKDRLEMNRQRRLQEEQDRALSLAALEQKKRLKQMELERQKKAEEQALQAKAEKERERAERQAKLHELLEKKKTDEVLRLQLEEKERLEKESQANEKLRMKKLAEQKALDESAKAKAKADKSAKIQSNKNKLVAEEEFSRKKMIEDLLEMKEKADLKEQKALQQLQLLQQQQHQQQMSKGTKKSTREDNLAATSISKPKEIMLPSPPKKSPTKRIPKKSPTTSSSATKRTRGSHGVISDSGSGDDVDNSVDQQQLGDSAVDIGAEVDDGEREHRAIIGEVDESILSYDVDREEDGDDRRHLRQPESEVGHANEIDMQEDDGERDDKDVMIHDGTEDITEKEVTMDDIEHSDGSEVHVHHPTQLDTTQISDEVDISVANVPETHVDVTESNLVDVQADEIEQGVVDSVPPMPDDHSYTIENIEHVPTARDDEIEEISHDQQTLIDPQSSEEDQSALHQEQEVEASGEAEKVRDVTIADEKIEIFEIAADEVEDGDMYAVDPILESIPPFQPVEIIVPPQVPLLEDMENLESIVLTLDIPKVKGELRMHIRHDDEGDRHGLFVHGFKPNSLAEQEGKVLIGDELIAVNGVSVEGKFLEDVAAALQEHTEDIVSIVVRRRPYLSSSFPIITYSSRVTSACTTGRSSGRSTQRSGVFSEEASPRAFAVKELPVDYPVEEKLPEDTGMFNYVSIDVPKTKGELRILIRHDDEGDRHGLFVHGFKPNSLAEQEGKVLIGDELIAVNGVSVEGKFLEDVAAALQGHQDDRVSMVVKRMLPQESVKAYQDMMEAFYKNWQLMMEDYQMQYSQTIEEEDPEDAVDNSQIVEQVYKVQNIKKQEVPRFISLEELHSIPFTTHEIQVSKTNGELRMHIRHDDEGDRHGLFVHGFKPNSLAEQEGKVLIGDELIAVNGVSVEGKFLEDVAAALQGHQENSVDMIVRRRKMEGRAQSRGPGTAGVGSARGALTLRAHLTPKHEDLSLLHSNAAYEIVDGGSQRPLTAPSIEYLNGCRYTVLTFDVAKTNGELRMHIRHDDEGDRHGLFVHGFKPNSLAEQEGKVLIGDELIAVNGVSVEGKFLEDVAVVLQGHRGDFVRMKIRRYEYSAQDEVGAALFGMGELPDDLKGTVVDDDPLFDSTLSSINVSTTLLGTNADFASTNNSMGDGPGESTYVPKEEFVNKTVKVPKTNGELRMHVKHRKDKDGLFIHGFKPNSRAEKLGIVKLGDEILEIEGEDLRGCKLERLIAILKDHKGNVVNMMIRRKV